MGQLCSCVRRRGYVDLDNENAEPGCCKKCCKECCDSCTQSISTCCKNFWKDLFDGICCCLPCVQTNDDHGPERVVGDFLFDTAMSKFWHVTLLLTNISISWSIWLVFNDFFLSDAWWAVLLFPGWMVITFIVTYICQLLMFGNQPNYVNDNRVWLYFSFLAMPALIILSDVWLVLSDERLGPSILTNLGEIVGIFFGRRPDTYQGDADYTFLFIKYVILTIMYILSAIFVIGYRWKWNCCGCKDGFEDTKKEYVKKSANFLHTHFNNQNLKTYQRRTYSKYPEDVNEKCETYCRKLFLLRLKEHLWPSTDNDSDCCLGVFTAQNVFYPVKLWVAAVLNVLVVLITAWTFFAFFIILGNNTEAAVGQVQEAAPGYCRLAIVSIEPGLAAFDAIVKGLGILNLDGENIFENVSAIDTSNLATEICNQCNLSTIDAVFDSTVFLSMNILSTINDTIKNGLNLSLIDIDPNSVNTTLFEAVFEALVIVNQSYSIFSQGATESCKVLATLLFFGDTKERIYTTGLTAFLLSVIVGLSASLITFAAWRKKFINHGLKAHTYPYPDSVDVHGLYPSHSYSRFVANFVGNGFASVVAVFLVVSLGSLVSLFFQVNAEIDNGSYIQRVDFWPVLGYPAISFAIYLALDLGLVETVIIPQFLQRRRFKGFGFVSIWLELFYLPKGLFAGLYKIFLLLFYFVAGFIRPDCSVFPFGLENWDASHVSYVSAIRFVYTRYYEYNLDDNDKAEHMQDVNSRNERDNENYKDLFRHEQGQPAVKALEI